MILFELWLGELADRVRGLVAFIGVGEVEAPAPSSFANDLLVRGI
jgi:hypothetical protein